MKILVGVTGGIAAYKAAYLVRLMVSGGHSVRVVMSESAKDFITPLTMATLSGSPVLVENFDAQNGAWNSHISLGEWADLFVIAPATANTIAKMASGVADNLLLCTYLSARCETVIAPAMDLDMWAHATTRRNVEYLRGLGVVVVEPEEGFLASGLVGKGRMAEPERILAVAERTGVAGGDFAGVRVMITSGATVERIDPVRFISNFSTGAMGLAMRDELCARGALVTMVTGQISAGQMYEKAREAFEQCDVAIFAAAVADYTPVVVEGQKIKHHGDSMMLELRKTKDIAMELSMTKRQGQFTLGFALETENGVQSAREKLVTKGLDAIVLNSLEDAGAGFGLLTNKVTIIDRDGARPFELKSKREVAVDIVNFIKEKYKC